MAFMRHAVCLLFVSAENTVVDGLTGICVCITVCTSDSHMFLVLMSVSPCGRFRSMVVGDCRRKSCCTCILSFFVLVPSSQSPYFCAPQVEYYFSRENLVQDQFLVSKMDKDHFVELSVIMDFKMMQALTMDQSQIIEALKTSAKVLNLALSNPRAYFSLSLIYSPFLNPLCVPGRQKSCLVRIRWLALF